MWNRIVLGIIGLALTFISGEQLQLWWDQGKVWHRTKGQGVASRLVSYDQEPILYVAHVSTFALGLDSWSLHGLGGARRQVLEVSAEGWPASVNRRAFADYRLSLLA